MAQPSVVSYFHTKKRSAVEDAKIARPKKVLVLDPSNITQEVFKKIESDRNRNVVFSPNNSQPPSVKVKKIEDPARRTPTPIAARRRINKHQETPKGNTIDKYIIDMAKKDKLPEPTKTTSDTSQSDHLEKLSPPTTPTKKTNTLDKIQLTGNELTLNEIKQKLTRSSRLAELKNSIIRFKNLDADLKKCEEKTSTSAKSPTIGTFKKIELEVQLSPKKILSPEKAYLSPKKESTVKKSLLGLFSPTKNAIAATPSTSRELFPVTTKPSLTLPFKYRSLAETFRAIDTVCQIMYNRQEVITFRKLKPAVEELSKKNLTEKHLGQIKAVYTDAFHFQQQKLKVSGMGVRKEQWELVVTPQLGENQDVMTPEILLVRRRKLYNTLIQRLKNYHNEFLQSLDPPMNVDMDKITRWHPEFDIERVPDIELVPLPQPPPEVTYTTGKEVLEKAKEMFNCNTRMEQALQKLKEMQEKKNTTETPGDKPKEIESVLKGIPKALLERVRQKQAAKTLAALTRSEDKEKEALVYSRLPEIARLARNLFVAEKKSVLPLDAVLDKLANSYRGHLPKSDMENHLKIIAKEAPDWLTIHEIRHTVFLKLVKNADVSVIIDKLECLAKNKRET